METSYQYRLRWQYPGGSTRTRYFDREHFAVKALARIQARGRVASLDMRPIVTLADWAPFEKVHSQTLCSSCGTSIQLADGEWLDSDRQTYCREGDDSPRHSA